MKLNENLIALATKTQQQQESILTEEATKNAFVMPFISTVLGYDVFNPLEVVPEFTADVGVKKGEKIDYAIIHKGEVQILIECKKSSEPLQIEHASQLFRYFAVTNARIAMLTNGKQYHCYTDLDVPNRMDAKPFLILDLTDIDETLIPELMKLSKESFDLDSIISAAGELKYIGLIKHEFATQFTAPTDEWIKFFTTRVYEGFYTQKVREQFTTLVSQAAKQFLNEQVNERLKTALSAPNFPRTEALRTEQSPTNQTVIEREPEEQSEIETTQEEIEAYQIVKAIACSEVKLDRIAQRDAKSYFSVILDNNNRKPVARFHFNRKQKYLGTFDNEKNETRHTLSTLDEIYDHAQTIRETIRAYH
ncbi:type I restriction endonuclease [Rathayibacter toxicus]|uniref:type I restriction endonuclease n=1 Tax=Rathayibacter toxicus TaxID=145458 RepID=UPI000CE7B868|nr:type I restriction endonuclease [Rathayibacter toxicus]PPI56007.1 restriction endonuclease [Rathayibacter toxicus]QOD10204.1 type I restriction enzyme HsdR N-terminal domain-containing protein [Rathayibacter toxicus]QWL28880.1 restriction endonuclease [Rathayibacter toxicus]QWL33067.1 restriction endonuclease [Rathayibacter toxicus]QWL35161.1 restriction endonuclease [Rathayibacter toxicus]